MTTESPQAAPSTPAPETPANPAEGAAAGPDIVTRLRELDEIKAAISDPAAVWVNMLRGTIAKPQAVSYMEEEITRLRAELDAATRALSPLDAVVHALGIEDSDDDPAEAVTALRERAEQAEAQLAKVADLVADAKRLDWLDTVNANMNAHSGTKYGWRYEINHIRAALTDCNYPPLTIREAIDEAMKRSEERSGR